MANKTMNFGVDLLPTATTTYNLGNSSFQWLIDASQLSSGTIDSGRIPIATSSAVGGIQIGYTASGKNYPVELSSNQAYVNVPWTDTNTKVKQLAATTVNSTFPVILGYSTTTSSVTNTVNKAAEFTYNPSTKLLSVSTNGQITAGTVAAYLNGNAKTCNTATVANRANYTSTAYGVAYYSNTSGAFTGTGQGTTAQVLLGKGNAAPAWGQIDNARITDATITTAKLAANSITIGTQTAVLGGEISTGTLVRDLGLTQVFTYKGVVSATPAVTQNTFNTYSNGDVVFVTNSTAAYVFLKGTSYSNSTWNALGIMGAHKVLQTAVSDPTASGTATTFVKSVTQDVNGKITVARSSIPVATASALGLMKVSTGLGVSSGAVSVTYGNGGTALATSASNGSANSAARSDHAHQLPHKVLTHEITATTSGGTGWTYASGIYTHTVSETFVTTSPKTDIKVNIQSGYENLISELIADTDTASKVTFKTDKLPLGTLNVKISLDKSVG